MGLPMIASTRVYPLGNFNVASEAEKLRNSDCGEGLAG